MASHLAGHKAGIGNAFFKLVSIFPEGFCIPLVFSVENLRTVERHGWIHPSALNSAERSALLRGAFSARRKLLRDEHWGGSTHVSQQQEVLWQYSLHSVSLNCSPGSGSVRRHCLQSCDADRWDL